MDEELFARAVATALGAFWAIHLKEKDQMKAISYADIFLENIDQLATGPEEFGLQPAGKLNPKGGR